MSDNEEQGEAADAIEPAATPTEYMTQAGLDDLRTHVDDIIKDGLVNVDEDGEEEQVTNNYVKVQYLKDLREAEKTGSNRGRFVKVLEDGLARIDDIMEEELPEEELSGEEDEVSLDRGYPVIEVGVREDDTDQLGVHVVPPDREETADMNQIQVADVLLRAATSVSCEVFAMIQGMEAQAQQQLEQAVQEEAENDDANGGDNE